MSKNRQRVVWTKGMFLTPQHFQTQDQYFEDASQFRFGASLYANRGVSSLSIDTESLANGLFRLLEGRGVMPDGLTFQMPDSDRLPPSREVADFFPPGKKDLDVYLAIPEQRIEAPNVKIPVSAEDGAGLAETRYTAETRGVADQNAGLERKDVQIARRNFRLLFDTEFRDGFSMLRIAQVTRNAAGQCVVKKEFIAPCLEIAHSEYLMGLIRRQIEILATKSATLS
ncbi:MAG: type VI secretion system baseplate subunit TssK, partial [Bryobacteraceae bacterium]